jgi:hypothetical protein
MCKKERKLKMAERSRNWVLTQNYKDEEPKDDNYLLNEIQNFRGIAYTAFQLEQGEEGTKHHHIILCFKDAKSFTTIKRYFPTAHIETMQGTPQQAVNYCTKDETRIRDFMTWGELPQQGERTDIQKIYDMLENECSLHEISSSFPGQYLRMRNNIISVQQDLLESKYENEFRKMDVIYLSDETGVGKTRYVMEKYEYPNVYRVSNYDHPFDAYRGQKVIVFEEFRNSLKIEDMLNYLDGYPLRLPARYGDKVACYDKVFIISNWPFANQYASIREDFPTTYQAFRRRIHFIGNLDSVVQYDATTENKQEEEVFEITYELFKSN